MKEISIIATASAFAAALVDAAAILPRQSAPPGGPINFDDLDAPPLDITSMQEIGDYRNLTWDGFRLSEVLPIPLGIVPESGSNVASQFVLSEPSGTNTLRAASDDVAAFTLQSFFFACTGPPAVAALVATPCTITLTSFRGDEQVSTQDVRYTPGLNLVKQPMQRASLGEGFANVDRVEFSRNGLVGSLATAVLYDSFNYKIFPAEE
ncbi:hypothetical protein MBLNU230_g0655t1 [Neophaeotheca triangularis]